MKYNIPHSKPTINSQDVWAVSKAIKSSNLTQGSCVKEFEGKFAKFFGLKEAVATSSGTFALHLALLSLEVKKGDEVIIPSYVCTALLNAINYIGAKARLVDVSDDDFNISVEDVGRKINKKTKAIIVPHMFGMPADIKALLKFKIPIIEDCAQSVGALYNNQKVGSFGVLSIFSFYATKMLATGEGGMVVSRNKKLLAKIRDLRDYDHKNDYVVRFNYKMTDFQAALGISQLSRLPSFIAKRKRIAKVYNKGLSNRNIRLAISKKGKDAVYFRYIIKVKSNKNKYIRELKKKGIFCAAPIYKPLHQYLKMKGFPVSERLAKENISIPIHPSLKGKEIKYIIRCVNNLK